ncbi:MAG: fused MFS/spermidine synthase [Caldilineaceae bacterium]|nr:fused MFS/spermidine synthase [Caldilineaceae bacterium]
MNPQDPQKIAWQYANRAALVARLEFALNADDETLFTEEWNGHLVAVTKEKNTLRLWLIDQSANDTDWVQSILHLTDPLFLPMSYTQAMMLALIWQPQPERIFVTGLGGGGLATVLHHYLWQTRIDCVELSPPVVAAAIGCFGFAPDERMSLTTGDALEALAQAAPRSYDILFLDLFFDNGETPEHLVTDDFFRLCQSRLRPGGLLTMNLGAKMPDFSQRLAPIAAHFPSVYTCRGHGSTQVVFATERPPIASFALTQQAMAIQQEHSFAFPYVPWVSRLIQQRPTPEPV